jgi:hypothetical protein
LVAMRARKPWVRTRLVLLGLRSPFFTARSPGGRSSVSEPGRGARVYIKIDRSALGKSSRLLRDHLSAVQRRVNPADRKSISDSGGRTRSDRACRPSAGQVAFHLEIIREVRCPREVRSSSALGWFWPERSVHRVQARTITAFL